jgi:DNA-binding NarL/FixJ family response regulator
VAHRDVAAVAEAQARMAQLDERFRRTVDAAGWPNPLLAAERATLVAEARRVGERPSPAAWRAAAEAWEAVERPYAVAYARWREAEAALATGESGTAPSALRDAHAIATRLGALPLRDAVAALARRARITLGHEPTSPDRAEPADGDRLGLTPRERDVLALVAEGRTNRQVAAALFISESTAGVHVSNILGKLGVRSRTEAAAVAYRLRLVPGYDEEPPAT